MKKEKSIETPELLIKGNIMCWAGMMLQLSNVSCISTTPLELLRFPWWSIAVLIIGLLTLTSAPIIGILFLAGSAICMFGWYYINQRRKKNTVLCIVMNSGNDFQFIIDNKQFLNQVLKVLELIIIDGGVGQQNVTINIRGNKITGNASVLNDLRL